MKCEWSYHSRWDGAKLVSVGVLVLGPNALTYYAPRQHAAFAREFNQNLVTGRVKNGMSNRELFDWWVASGNGLTTDWSKVATAQGKSMDQLGAKLLGEMTPG